MLPIFKVHPVLLQWIRDNHPAAEKIMVDFEMVSELGAIGMLRHQVRDVAAFTGIPTTDLAKYMRLIYEILPKERLRIVLIDVNINGIQDGHVSMCQVLEDDDRSEVVETVYVKDLLDKHEIKYRDE